MNKLKFLENMGFKISWKLINIGLFGNDEIPILITCDDVLEYLDSLLTEINEQTDNIIALICKKDDFVEFKRFLKELANEDDLNVAVQKRKWRAYLLKKLIDNIGEDCLRGLLELMEFWISMGKPEDCPQTFPINDNKDAVQDYFSQSSYSLIVDKNRAWLNEEIATIVKLET